MTTQAVEKLRPALLISVLLLLYISSPITPRIDSKSSIQAPTLISNNNPTPQVLPHPSINVSLEHQILDGASLINATLTLPDACIQVLNWGSPSQSDNSFSANATLIDRNGMEVVCAEMIITVQHTYELGPLSPGNYNFTLNICLLLTETHSTDCSLVETLFFTVSDTSPPSWPAGSTLSATNITPSSLTMTWTPAKDDLGVTSYRIFENTTMLATVPGTVNIYTVTGLAPDTQYAFKIEAGDAVSQWTSDGPTRTLTTPAQPPPAPALPREPAASSWQQYWYLIAAGIAATIITILLLARTHKILNRE